MWSKKAQFHNVGNGGQFCWPLAWLTLNDLIFHLHWNPDSQTQKFLLGKLQTSESIVRHEFLIFFLPRKSWCLVFLIRQSFTRMFWLFFCPINRSCVGYAYIKYTGITPFRASASSTLAGCLFILFPYFIANSSKWETVNTVWHPRKFRERTLRARLEASTRTKTKAKAVKKNYERSKVQTWSRKLLFIIFTIFLAIKSVLSLVVVPFLLQLLITIWCP